MTTVPMTPDELLSQLKKWRIPYKEYRDWRTHNRNHKGPWGPVNGFMWHHTGSNDADQRELLYNGYEELPGPLCHFGIAQDGVAHLIGWGRANHAGKGDSDVLEAVINEVEPPVDNEANTDGNTHFYGAEFWYDGSKPMTIAQFNTGVRLSCAIFDFHGWNEYSAIFHGMWQIGKWDPGMKTGTMMNIGTVRSVIKTTLEKGPNPVPGSPVDNPDPKDATYKSVWDKDAARPPKGEESATNPTWTNGSILRYAAEEAHKARVNTEKILKHLGLG